MNIKKQVEELDTMVAKGDIVNAVKKFFAKEAKTSDYGNVSTQSKNQMIEKMESFVGSIKEIIGIKHHISIVEGELSVSEFTFHFKMGDGSFIYWHEIIKRIWNGEGRVISEEYFDAKNQPV